jgi:hypothetical protein
MRKPSSIDWYEYQRGQLGRIEDSDLVVGVAVATQRSHAWAVQEVERCRAIREVPSAPNGESRSANTGDAKPMD